MSPGLVASPRNAGLAQIEALQPSRRPASPAPSVSYFIAMARRTGVRPQEHSPFSRCRGYGRRGRIKPCTLSSTRTDSPGGMWCEGAAHRTGTFASLELTSVDEDVVASQLEEGRDVLEHKVKASLLPVGRVIGELDRSLDIYWVLELAILSPRFTTCARWPTSDPHSGCHNGRYASTRATVLSYHGHVVPVFYAFRARDGAQIGTPCTSRRRVPYLLPTQKEREKADIKPHPFFNSPISIDFRNVQSIALPMVYVVPLLNTTWPPLLHSWNAARMFAESSAPLPLVLTVQSLVRSGGDGTGSRGCFGDGLIVGRDEAATQASSAAHRRLVARILRVGCNE